MSRLIATFDWSRTQLGPMAEWPRSLKTMLNVCLRSRFQLAIYWGPDLILLYNDAEREVLGSLHPHALGKPAREALVDMWDTVGPMLQGVLETGEATWSVDRPLDLARYGFLEKAYFTWSYSPIPGDVGGIGGVLLVTQETTERVLSERRLRTLKEMATETGRAQSVEQACASAVRILSGNSEDVPFALLYVPDATGSFTLVSSSGVRASPTGEQFPFERAGREREVIQTDNLARYFGAGAARRLTKTALILPIRESGPENLAGFLVVGVSDHLRFDAAYRNFFDLVGSQVGMLIASAHAREQEHKLFRQSDDVIHRLAGKLITAQEEERKRIARDLHDDFAQRLSLLCIEMDTLRRNHPAATDITDKLGDLVKHTEGVIESVRQISHRLHHTSLQLGLPRAAARYCREFSQSLGIQVKFAQTGGITSLPEPIPLIMFRVLQEALSNVVKHSGADQVEVSLLFDDDAVRLWIKDRGRGFDTSQISDGLGLISMRERLRLVGGKITVTSVLGRGTELEATVPWSSDLRSR